MAGTVFNLLIVAWAAWLSPPNNWDSLTYHLSRVAHWIQNQSVASYPTNIIRQLCFNPWAEFAIMHFQVLLGGDRLANFIQWFALAGGVIGVSAVAKELGADRKGQFFAALLTATIPMGILQGSSTQNDLVAAFWLVCFVYFVLLLRNEFQWIYAVAAGGALGLGFLTKGTSYVYAAPFLAWFILTSRRDIRRLGQSLAVLAVIVLILNLGYYLRNYDLFRTILLPASENHSVRAQAYGFGYFLSNVLRNVVLHFGTPSPAVNSLIKSAVSSLHAVLGMDPSHPAITLENWGMAFEGHLLHEDHAGNFLHTLLISAGAVCFLILFRPFAGSRDKPANKYSLNFSRLGGYLAALFAAGILFNIFLKWQPWNARLHLPLFVLCMPFAATVLPKIMNDKFRISVALLLFAGALPWLFLNHSRPLLAAKNIFTTGRMEQYFANNPGFRYSYEQAAQEAKSTGCRQIGLSLGGNSWEYPLWVLLRPGGTTGPRLEHVRVVNESAKTLQEHPFNQFDPCVIIADDLLDQSKIVIGRKNFVRTRKFAFLAVFRWDESGELAKRSAMYHFYRVLEYSRHMKMPVGRNDEKRRGDKGQSDILALWKKQLQEARWIDPADLNRIYPGLGDHWRDNLVAGLEK
ncbi:MAG: glycosyltransferase family 39 protein, partial [Candidatus Omnitrophota bacterium]